MDMGFEKGSSPPCTFCHPQKHICLTVHGDDFVSEGNYKALSWMDCMLRKHFEVQTEIMGADPGLVKEMRLLNRLVTWTPRGIMSEPDPRHGEIVIRELGLDGDGVSSLVTPGEKIAAKPKVASEKDGTYFCAECDHVHAFGEWPAELSNVSGCDYVSSGKQDLDDMIRSSEESSNQSRKHTREHCFFCFGQC